MMLCTAEFISLLGNSPFQWVITTIPVCKNPCPVDGHTRREYVKVLTSNLERENPGVKTRLFHAIVTGKIPGWENNLSEEVYH